MQWSSRHENRLQQEPGCEIDDLDGVPRLAFRSGAVGRYDARAQGGATAYRRSPSPRSSELWARQRGGALKAKRLGRCSRSPPQPPPPPPSAKRTEQRRLLKSFFLFWKRKVSREAQKCLFFQQPQYVGLGEAGRLIHFPSSLPPSQLPAALPPPRPWRRYGPPAPGGSLSLLRRLTYSYRTQPVGAPPLIAGLRTRPWSTSPPRSVSSSYVLVDEAVEPKVQSKRKGGAKLDGTRAKGAVRALEAHGGVKK